jgi:hypothetical protein
MKSLRLAATVLPLIATVWPCTVYADQSTVIKSWRTSEGWLTELRQHTDGARVCAMGKAFNDSHPFGISVVKAGQITLITLVDQQDPPSRGGAMILSASGQPLGVVTVEPAGPAFATTEGESGKTWDLIKDLAPGIVAIDVDGRQYRANFAGIEQARAQLRSCEDEAAS